MHVSKHIKPKKVGGWMELVDAVLEEGERAHAIFPTNSSYGLLVVTNLRLFGLDWAHRKTPTTALKKALSLGEIMLVRAKAGWGTGSIEVEAHSGDRAKYGSLDISDVEEVLIWIELATEEMNLSPTIDDSAFAAKKAKADDLRAKLEAGPTLKDVWNDMRVGMHGTLNSELMCQHCQTRGHVRTQKVDQKSGVTGLLGTIVTGGLTLVVPSPKDTLAWCSNCKTEWRITK
jgi:hypothetical protein